MGRWWQKDDKYHHVGPFNTVRRYRKSGNDLDEASRIHDIAYGRFGGWSPYFKYSSADEQYLNRIKNSKGALASVARGFFKAKKAFAPRLGTLPTPPDSRENRNKQRRSRSPDSPSPPSLPQKDMAARTRQYFGAGVNAAIKKARAAQAQRRLVSVMAKRFKPKRRSSGPQINTVSGGFVKKPRKIKKTPVNKAVKKGYVRTFEFSGIKQATYNLIIGHSTMARKIGIQLAAYSLAKAFLNRQGLGFPTWEDQMSLANIQVGDTWKIVWKASPDSATTLATAYTYAAAGTYDNLVAGIQTVFLSNPVDTIYVGMYYTPVAGNIYFPYLAVSLEGAKIEWSSKSSLKMQNRSYETSEVSDVVNNVPLYGRSYEKRGNSIEYKRPSTDGFSTNEDNAFLYVAPLSYANPMKEPQLPQMYNVKKAGKVHMEAGQLQTSNLYSHSKMLLNQFLTHCQSNAVGNYSSVGIGKIRMFQLEKMLEVAASPTANSIKVGCEHQLRLTAVTTFHNSYTTVPKFDNAGL